MSAALSNLRRLVASLMLVAMASFVLHGAAMAGFHPHKAGFVDCGPVQAHSHQSKAHDHGGGIVHIHAQQAADVAGHDHSGGDHAGGGTDDPCCSSVCSVTLVMLGIEVVSSPMRLARILPLESQFGAGIDQGGLKRPPRTPSIA